MHTVKVIELNGGAEYEVQFHAEGYDLYSVENYDGTHSDLMRMAKECAEWCAR